MITLTSKSVEFSHESLSTVLSATEGLRWHFMSVKLSIFRIGTTKELPATVAAQIMILISKGVDFLPRNMTKLLPATVGFSDTDP